VFFPKALPRIAVSAEGMSKRLADQSAPYPFLYLIIDVVSVVDAEC